MGLKFIIIILSLSLISGGPLMAGTPCPSPSDIGWYLKTIKFYRKALLCSYGNCNFVPPKQRHDRYVFTQAAFKYTHSNITRTQAEQSFFMDGKLSKLDNPNISIFGGTCKYDVTNQVDSTSCSQTKDCQYMIWVQKYL